MTIKNLFSITTLLTFALGIAWLAFPEAMIVGWGATANEIAVYMSRRYAMLFFGYALIFWLTRKSSSAEMHHAIVMGGFVVTALMAMASLAGVFSATINWMGLIPFIVEAWLTCGFGYFLFARSA